MTHQDFTMWLKGFMVGKNKLSTEEVKLINKQMDNIIDVYVQPTVAPYPTVPTPNLTPYCDPHLNRPFDPMNPFVTTCETKQQLNG